VEKFKASSIAGGNLKLYSHFEKYFIVPQKQNKTELHNNPAIPPLNIYPRELKIYINTKICTQMFRAALSIIAKKYKQPKCLSADEWINKL